MGLTSLADIEPVRLVRGERMSVPGTDLHVTLHSHVYHRGRDAGGAASVVKWAEITFETDADDVTTDRFAIDAIHDIGGHRVYLAGTRRSVKAYLLPDSEDDT